MKIFKKCDEIISTLLNMGKTAIYEDEDGICINFIGNTDFFKKGDEK